MAKKMTTKPKLVSKTTQHKTRVKKQVLPDKPEELSRKSRYMIKARYICKWVGIPFALYLLFFTVYAWTWMSHFNTHYFTDAGDGFQNVWNMWWVKHSVTDLHQLPWHTNFLHFPYGTTLIAQTLSPFNGFVAIALQTVFSLVQSYNIMVIFSFVFGGTTMFWLCYYFSRKYTPSLIGGFFFTFSSYHFAHAIGHMQLVSLEFIPLFILLWWKLLTKPRYRTAVAAAITLLLILFCDYYYFIYSVLSGGLIAIYLWRTKQLAPIKLKANFRPWIVFLAIAAVICLPLPLALLHVNSNDPLTGSHDSRVFSTDLLAPVIDGGFWHFHSLTDGYWHKLHAYIAESSVYFGVSALVVIGIALWKRNKLNKYVGFWLLLGAIFGLLSLGPRLMVFGYSINHAPLPYALLERIFPELKLSGVPNRLIVMTFLATAILIAIVLSKLDLKQRKGQVLTALFCIVMAFELWPGKLPTTVVNSEPKYVRALAKLPPGAVFDNAAKNESWALYDQTITEKPMAFGYISRTPTSVYNKDWQLTAIILRSQYSRVCSQYHIRYVTTLASRPLPANYKVVYQDSHAIIYDLKDSKSC